MASSPPLPADSESREVSEKSGTRSYKDPFIVQPSGPHTHTIILLHGRGSNGPKFGKEFITSASSTGKNLSETFPFAKFIFPTAKKRRAVVFKRMPINQWFDLYDINRQGYREHLSVDGLQETTGFIHGLIEQEVQGGIAAERIVMGGLSQGCAASLYSLLCFNERLGGYVGMSGWLPFARHMQDIIEDESEGSSEDDIFARSDDEASESEKESTPDQISKAINFARENISHAPLSSSFTSLPVSKTLVFLGHGALDEKVKCNLGEGAQDVLMSLGFRVTWKKYNDLGHWYSVPDEIDDIERFLEKCLV
ncbi:hypothetical protein H072_646 [Dactylellina haptotyla CBS 200.50]|uniref:Acyl-protein thioesterase 1 n=1 Tax=Dactylellina haptotyla (strain CBS 200.50) TaxID=1284197 RepID=S8CCI9_DACHA|nr:hypothetical protein H072_646 [Dactylellina haptotyla CBS 200.50]